MKAHRRWQKPLVCKGKSFRPGSGRDEFMCCGQVPKLSTSSVTTGFQKIVKFGVTYSYVHATPVSTTTSVKAKSCSCGDRLLLAGEKPFPCCLQL